jgi:hypothetical protein
VEQLGLDPFYCFFFIGHDLSGTVLGRFFAFAKGGHCGRTVAREGVGEWGLVRYEEGGVM